MPNYKKWIAAAMVCGGFVISWKVMTAATILSPPEKFAAHVTTHGDNLADKLNHQITSVTRLANSHARPVIFDNDAAPDDTLALILIGNDPGVDLKAITVTGTGEAHGLQGAVNMAAVVGLLGKPQVPVAYGRGEPLTKAGKPFPPFIREHRDNLLSNSGVKPVADTEVSDNAVALMHEVIATSKEKVTILATGPLTNIAEFVKKYPQLKGKIERIVMMGGALKVPGNIEIIVPDANNKVSEWNFYADPAAAHDVFAAGIPVTLIALDATNQVPLTRDFYEAIKIEDQPDMRLAHHLLKTTMDLMGEDKFFQKYYMWDTLAAMVLVDPSIAETKLMPLSVDAANGQVKLAAKGEHGAPVTMVTKITHPDAVLKSFVALVKSNHLFAQRKFYQDAPLNRMRAHA